VGVIYDPAASAEVSFAVASSDSTNLWNRFHFQLANADPLAAKTTTEPTRWLSFRNFAFQDEGMSFSSVWGPYSQYADRLGPVLVGANSWRWPYLVAAGVQPYGQPDYQAHFINADGHPRQYYTTAAVSVTYQGASFLDLAESVPTFVEADAGIALWAKRDCNDPKAVEVGMFLDRPETTTTLPFMSEPAVITRLSVNQWQIDIDQPIKLIEYGCQETTTVVGRKTKTSCTTYAAGGWWTYPVKFTLIVTRVTS
jgi:hypothetical protein